MSFNSEKRVNLKWCWDSTNGEKLLIDMESGQVVARGQDLEDAARKESTFYKDALAWKDGFDDGYRAAEDDLGYMIADLECALEAVTDERDYLLRLSHPDYKGDC